MTSARRAVAWWMVGLAMVLVPACGGEQGGKLSKDLQVTDTEIGGPPEAVVAKVDGHAITLAEVNAIANLWAGAAAQQGAPAEPKRAHQMRAIDSMIDQFLLAEEAGKRGFSVPDSMIQQMMANWERQFPNEVARNQRLAETQMTVEGLREKFRMDAIVQMFVREAVQDTLQVRDQELQAYYDGHPEQFMSEEQIHARHILVQCDPNAAPEVKTAAREKIDGLLRQVRGGGDFGTLARQNSDCPSKENGGDLGFFGRRQMVPPFAEAAFALQPGQVSGVVETQFGYHIIKLEERRPGGKMELAPIADRLRAFLARQKLQEAVDRLAVDLREKAKVEMAF